LNNLREVLETLQLVVPGPIMSKLTVKEAPSVTFVRMIGTVGSLVSSSVFAFKSEDEYTPI